MSNTSSSTLELILKAIDHASPTLGKVASAMRSQGVQAGVSAAITTKAMGLAGQALHKVIDFLGDSKAAYREQEVAQNRLTTSLNANAPAWRSHAEDLKRVNEAGIALGFTDTEVTNSMARLVAATHDVGKATEILAVAQDLARFKGVNLEEATLALTKVEGGQYRALKALGIQLKAGATSTEAMAAVMKVAGGQAQSFANSDLGKVQIESAKAEQSQEKFGKVISRLEAFILPAATEALGAFADAIDDISTIADQTAPATSRLDAIIDGLEHNVIGTLPPVRDLIEQLKKMRDASLAAAAAGSQHGDELIGTRVAIKELGLAETQAHPPTEELATDLQKVATAADYANAALDTMAKTVETQLFGKAITAGNEARFKENIADLIEQRKQVKEGSLKWIELTGQIAENRQSLFALHLEQAASAGPQAAVAFLEQQRAKFGDANGAIARLITNYKALIVVQGQLLRSLTTVAAGRYAGKPIPLFAAGGFAPPDQPAIVGENGPELLVPRGQGVDVVPQAQWGNYGGGSGSGGWGGGGTPVQIPVMLDGREIGRVVDRRLYLALAGAGGSTRPR